MSEAKKASLIIQHDDEPASPREWDNLGKMACWHRNYRLGDEPYNLWTGVNPKEFLDELPKGTIVLPLYLYDHSGITMSTKPFSCIWDSGQVGYIYATPEKIRECYMVKRISRKTRAKAEAVLVSEVETYDLYLTGQCWGYVFTNEKGEEDSCWGFYGGTLEETGLADAVPEEARSLLKEAWESRYND